MNNKTSGTNKQNVENKQTKRREQTNQTSRTNKQNVENKQTKRREQTNKQNDSSNLLGIFAAPLDEVLLVLLPVTTVLLRDDASPATEASCLSRPLPLVLLPVSEPRGELGERVSGVFDDLLSLAEGFGSLVHCFFLPVTIAWTRFMSFLVVLVTNHIMVQF